MPPSVRHPLRCLTQRTSSSKPTPTAVSAVNQCVVFRSIVHDSDPFPLHQAQFRNFIQKGGKHPPERGRYLLYVGYICPWACRTLIARSLKGLEDVIDVAVVYYHLGDSGWEFRPDYPGCTPDPLFGAKYIKDVYHKADPEYDLRYTIPVLWDKKEGTIGKSLSCMHRESLADATYS